MESRLFPRYDGSQWSSAWQARLPGRAPDGAVHPKFGMGTRGKWCFIHTMASGKSSNGKYLGWEERKRPGKLPAPLGTRTKRSPCHVLVSCALLPDEVTFDVLGEQFLGSPQEQGAAAFPKALPGGVNTKARKFPFFGALYFSPAPQTQVWWKVQGRAGDQFLSRRRHDKSMFESLLPPKCVILNPWASLEHSNLAVLCQFGINLFLRKLEVQYFWSVRLTSFT